MLESIREMMNIPESFSNLNGGLCTFQPTVGNSSLMAVNLAKKMAIQKELKRDPTQRTSDILKKLVGYFPSTSHSHCVKSLSLLDIQHNRAVQSVYLKDLNTYNVDLEGLESQIAEDKSNGLIPFFCMGVLGTTATGANDDLRSLSVISKRNDMFFMIDGAWGGAFLADPQVHVDLENQLEDYARSMDYKYGKLEPNTSWNFDGVDCIVINLSKIGLTGMDVTLSYINNRTQKSPAINGFFNTFEAEEDQELGSLSNNQYNRLSDCAKAGILKLHYMLQSYGRQGFINHLRLSIENAKKMENFMRQDQRFELVPKRCYSMTLFKLKGVDEKQSEFLTKQLIEKIDANDRMFVVGGKVDGIYFLRFSTISKAQDRHLEEIWGYLQQFATEIYQENNL